MLLRSGCDVRMSAFLCKCKIVIFQVVITPEALLCHVRNDLKSYRSEWYMPRMDLDKFTIYFEHASAHAEATLLAAGTVFPLFTIVDRRGYARPVVADFTSEAAKEASFAIIRMMCVAEAAIAVFHHSEAWAVFADTASGMSSLKDGQSIEVLLVAGTVRIGSRLTQKLRVREIKRGASGTISHLSDLPVSVLGAVDIQHLQLQGRLLELIPTKPPTFIDCWRARGNLAHTSRHLARGRSAGAR